MKLELEPDFVERLAASFGRDVAEAWAVRLPGLVAELLDRWRLTPGEIVLPMRYGFVLFAERADGSPCVLKIGVPGWECDASVAALAAYRGEGSARLLEASASEGAVLLERLTPGTGLLGMDDAAATSVMVGTAQVLWRPLEPGHAFISMHRWTEALREAQPREALPAVLLGRAQSTLRGLLADPGEPVLLHGDLHHENILHAGTGWAAIDPKGLAGDREYDFGTWFLNPYQAMPGTPGLRALTHRRVRQIAGETGLDGGRVAAWGLVHAMLSACWTLGDAGPPPDLSWVMEVAQSLADFGS